MDYDPKDREEDYKRLDEISQVVRNIAYFVRDKYEEANANKRLQKSPLKDSILVLLRQIILGKHFDIMMPVCCNEIIGNLDLEIDKKHLTRIKLDGLKCLIKEVRVLHGALTNRLDQTSRQYAAIFLRVINDLEELEGHLMLEQSKFEVSEPVKDLYDYMINGKTINIIRPKEFDSTCNTLEIRTLPYESEGIISYYYRIEEIISSIEMEKEIFKTDS